MLPFHLPRWVRTSSAFKSVCLITAAAFLASFAGWVYLGFFIEPQTPRVGRITDFLGNLSVGLLIAIFGEMIGAALVDPHEGDEDDDDDSETEDDEHAEYRKQFEGWAE